jgi:hypothetical protein
VDLPPDRAVGGWDRTLALTVRQMLVATPCVASTSAGCCAMRGRDGMCCVSMVRAAGFTVSSPAGSMPRLSFKRKVCRAKAAW